MPPCFGPRSRRPEHSRAPRLGAAARLLLALLAAATAVPLAAQRPETLPDSLQQMIETERAFAARALAVGWKAAYLEYFSDTAVGFD